jgi:hypothetical protein
MKCAFKRSAVAFPSVIRRWLKSLLKKAFAPPVSVTASTCIGKLGMFIENALQKKHRTQMSLSKTKYQANGKFLDFTNLCLQQLLIPIFSQVYPVQTTPLSYYPFTCAYVFYVALALHIL